MSFLEDFIEDHPTAVAVEKLGDGFIAFESWDEVDSWEHVNKCPITNLLPARSPSPSSLREIARIVREDEELDGEPTAALSRIAGWEHDPEGLNRWADANPELWGNKNGWGLHYDAEAFGVTAEECNSEIIAKHFDAVADRIEAAK